MKKTVFTLITLLLSTVVGFANPKPIAIAPPDEGMWLPMFFKQLNYSDMQRLGCRLTAEELYSINNSSLKDAIVQMGSFCTGEIVSPYGLMFTNHHCGYDAIVSSSTVEHDYLANGFWAESYEQEIPIEGLYVSFLKQMYDVTDDVLGSNKDALNKSQFAQEIQNKIDSLKKQYSEEGKYRVEVLDFFEGNNYYMFVYELFNDVRLVGAPPASIGKFGGDTDNWMWPRHTGDFSIFRVYADKDNKPAQYSKDNVPYKPKHYLPISIKGVDSADFAMIWGYPGSTQRYMTSYEVRNTLENINPSIYEAGRRMLPVMKAHMDKDNAVNLKYASTYASIMNTWKNKQGESRGLNRLHVYDKKKAIEDRLQNWINTSSQGAKYKDVIKDLEITCKQISDSPNSKVAWYHSLGFYLSERSLVAMRISFLYPILDKGNKLDSNALGSFKAQMNNHFLKTDPSTEKDLFKAFMQMEYELPQDYRIEPLIKLIDSYGGVDKFTEECFTKSIFANERNFNKFIKKPKLKTLQKDPMYKATILIYGYLNGRTPENELIEENFANARQNFVMALREMDSTIVRYPDANFSMRMTYGQVLDYYPADAIHYDYTTTLDGVMEKEDSTNDEFIVPKKLKELYQAKDYGQYKDKNGNMTVCFLTNNDITGGNSGSPVINGNGELIGLAFDGNWEAMSGDVAFEPELQRTICVDARYVLFIIDKFANCQRLIDELTIVK